MVDYVLTNRERSKEAERDRMPKHGANFKQVYDNAIRKRNQRNRCKQAAESRRKRAC